MDQAARYELLENLGTGAYSTVYRARDNELGREVAIKEIHAEQLGDTRASDRYWAEAQVLASLQHPHVVTIYDIVRSRGWLVLELMQASLRDRLNGRPMDVRALRTTLIHALKALKYLHARGLIHSDINPGNLMIDHRKRVKLGDFGVSRGLAAMEGGIGRGTAKYMAPESLAGKVSQIGPVSDLYSLGFSCYELLCGAGFRDLFPGLDLSDPQSDATWMMWHAAADRRLPPISQVLEGVPSDLASIIDRMICKDPSARYQSADEILDQLGENTHSADRESQPATGAEEALPLKKPRPWVIAFCVLSMLMSVGLLLFPTGPAPDAVPPPVIHGVVRGVDLNRRVIEIEDPQNGVPEEFPLPAKPKILLLKSGEADQFILPRDLATGDWIQIHRPTDPRGEPTFKVSRPVSQSGELRVVDLASQRVTISIESGRLRDEVVMLVTPRTRITLNEQPAKLGELRPGDQVTVEHLLDPTGKAGQLVSRLSATRGEEVTGFIQSINATNRQMAVATRRMAKDGRLLTLAQNCTSQLSTGDPLSWDQVRIGDRVCLRVDSQVRSVTITRGDSTESGLFAGSGDLPGTFRIASDEGQTMTFALAETVDIRLHGEPATLDQLRAVHDRITLTIRDGEDGVSHVTALDAQRGMRHNRWVIVIGCGAYSDPSVNPVPHFATDARALHQTLTRFYGVDPAWGKLLVDPEIQTVREEVPALLSRVTEPMQLIVALFGHAYRNKDGRLYLAYRDYRRDDPAGSGLPLESVVQALERCPAKDKLLLLDLVPEGALSHGQGALDLPQMLATLTVPLKTLRIIGASSEGEQSVALDGQLHGWFGNELSIAYRGAADEDRDLTITPDDLMKHLNQVAFDEQSQRQQHPFEWDRETP